MISFQPAADIPNIDTSIINEKTKAEPAGPIQPVKARMLHVQALTNIQAKTWEISCAIAASLGFGSMVQGKSDSQYRVFCFDCTATTPILREDTPAGAAGPRLSIDGVGFRVCIVVQKTSATVGVSLDVIAAKVTGQTLVSNKQALAIGLLPPTDATIAVLLNGEFDTSFFEQLSRACVAFGNDLASRLGEIDVYRLESAQLATSPGYELENGISSSYVVHSLVRGLSYDELMSRLKKRVISGNQDYDYARVVSTITEHSYRHLMGNTPSNQRPNKEQIRSADSIYNGYRPK